MARISASWADLQVAKEKEKEKENESRGASDHSAAPDPGHGTDQC